MEYIHLTSFLRSVPASEEIFTLLTDITLVGTTTSSDVTKYPPLTEVKYFLVDVDSLEALYDAAMALDLEEERIIALMLRLKDVLASDLLERASVVFVNKIIRKARASMILFVIDNFFPDRLVIDISVHMSIQVLCSRALQPNTYPMVIADVKAILLAYHSRGIYIGFDMLTQFYCNDGAEDLVDLFIEINQVLTRQRALEEVYKLEVSYESNFPLFRKLLQRGYRCDYQFVLYVLFCRYRVEYYIGTSRLIPVTPEKTSLIIGMILRHQPALVPVMRNHQILVNKLYCWLADTKMTWMELFRSKCFDCVIECMINDIYGLNPVQISISGMEVRLYASIYDLHFLAFMKDLIDVTFQPNFREEITVAFLNEALSLAL